MASETRSLQTVRDLLTDPERRAMALKLMRESNEMGGMLARRGGSLAQMNDKEMNSVLSSLDRFARFLDTQVVAESTRHSTFDLADLRSGKMTIYLVLPAERMRAQSALLRMWIASSLRAVVKGGISQKELVHFIMDEMASVGHLECVDDAIDKYRDYKVRMQFYFQSPAQAKICFPNGQDQTLHSNTSQVYFGVSDLQTAEAISARIGESTIIVESGGNSRGSSTSWSMGAQGQEGGGTSDNTSTNWTQQARKLAKPEEILTESLRTAFSFVPGMAPVRSTLLRYYEENWLRYPPGRIKRMLTASFVLVMSATMCALSLALAVWISPPVVREWLGSFVP